MQRHTQKYLAWILIALFVVSAGHGILFHTEHGHDHGPSDCALCVLAWVIAIASLATCVFVPSPQHVYTKGDRNAIPDHLRAHTIAQRAPPAITLR